MSFKSWSTLCMLSLSFPTLICAGSFWFFSSTPETPCPPKNEDPKVYMEKKGREEGHCETPPQCEALKPCCETKTVTEGITICEDPCHPSHCHWEVALSFGAGYRHDRLKQKTTFTDGIGEQHWKSKYRDFNSVMGVLRIDTRVYDFLFGLEGNYSPIVNGELRQSFHNITNPAQTSFFNFHKMTGYEADALASIGYRLRFINDTQGKAYLVPQVGYRYSHQSYETERHDRFVNPSQAGNQTQFLQDQAPNHSEWFGPFLEARLSFVFWNHFHVNPYYQYYLLTYHSRKKTALTTFTADPLVVGAIPSQQSIIQANFNNHSARGQSAGGDLYWQFDHPFRLGVKGSWTSFETRRAKAHVKTELTVYNTNPPQHAIIHSQEDAQVRWTNYSIYLYGGYSF